MTRKARGKAAKPGEPRPAETDAPRPDEPEAAPQDGAQPTTVDAGQGAESQPATDAAPAETMGQGQTPNTRRQALRPRLVRFAGAFLFGLLAVLAISAGGLYAYDIQFSGRILPGVRVGSTDLSGLTAAQASARLAEDFAALGEGELVLTAGPITSHIEIGGLGRRPDLETMVSEAMAVGRGGGPVQRFVLNARTVAQGVVLEPRATINRAAVEEAVSAFLRSVALAPVDAAVTGHPDGFQVVPGQAGRMVDHTGLADRIADALAPVSIPAQVQVSAPIIEIPPVVTTAEAETAKAAAYRMIGDVVIEDLAGTWTVPASQVATWISFAVTGDGGYRPVADPEGLEEQLGQMAKAIARPAANASYLFDKNGAIVGASEGRDGRMLDADRTIDAISEFLDGRASGSGASSVSPAVTLTRPELTTEEAVATAPLMKKISEWTTYFPIYENNGFGANIWIPAMDIDGYVVTAGAWFDFWKAIGPVTRERGYTDGGAIINGKTEPQGALAGGICSTSTTLFNAALRAGLQIGARRNHYYYIGRYPLGLDATVFQSSSGSIQTMSFRNDTDYPILIRAYKIRKGSSGYVKFELYGVPTGRQVEMGTPIVKNVKTARDTIEYTDELPVGTEKRIEHPADGKDVWVTVTVRDAAGDVLRETTYYSHYARVDGILQMGTGT